MTFYSSISFALVLVNNTAVPLAKRCHITCCLLLSCIVCCCNSRIFNVFKYWNDTIAYHDRADAKPSNRIIKTDWTGTQCIKHLYEQMIASKQRDRRSFPQNFSRSTLQCWFWVDGEADQRESKSAACLTPLDLVKIFTHKTIAQLIAHQLHTPNV